VPEENYAGSFGYQWNLHAKTQLDSQTGFSISRDRLFGVTGWPQDLTGQRVLEAGSGAGRFTEVLLSTGAEVFSLDYSSAVDSNWENHSGHPNLNLCQGDIFDIPLKRASFDKVLCIGVIQHTPDPEKAFQSLAQHVRPGGELVIDSYTRRLVSLMQWKYLLRPITRRMKKETLYRVISRAVPALLPPTIWLRRVAGRIGARLSPISEYSDFGLPFELNKQWSILDTFDMYSPAHDHPQSIATIRAWYQKAGFEKISVQYGPNGVVAKGTLPTA
jgi:SAM-dependent methyltransferase